MAFVRDIFTGELVERPESGSGRQIIARIEHPWGNHRHRKRAWQNYVNLGMSLKPEEVTRERIDHENDMAKKHNTGAYYDDRGQCHCDSRHVLAREGRRRGHQMNDAGYGDYAGR